MDSIISLIIGVVCIIIGIKNRRGDISTLHSYHTKRIREEDKLPFGKIVGLGMIIVGCGLILMGVLSYLATALANGAYLIAGYATLIAGLVIGLGIAFYGIFKYNKGIF